MPLLAINHHYFRDKEQGRGIYPISSVRLAEEVEILAKYWRIGTEDDVLAYCEKTLPPDDYVFLLTFDDGLKEQMKAIDQLKGFGMSAVCFVPTVPIVSHTMLEVHKIHMIRSVQCDEALAENLNQFGFFDYTFDDDLLGIQYRYDSTISRQVKYFLNFVLEKTTRDKLVRRLFEDLFGSEKLACEKLYMDASDLKYLSEHCLLGTHSHRHLPLATLSPMEAEEEIAQSMDIIENLSGYRVLGISYPYGGKAAVSPELFSIAKKCGLKYGFTMERGINPADSGDAFSLKRIDTNDVSEWCEIRL